MVHNHFGFIDLRGQAKKCTGDKKMSTETSKTLKFCISKHTDTAKYSTLAYSALI